MNLIKVDGKKSYSELLATGILPLLTGLLCFMMCQKHIEEALKKLPEPAFSIPFVLAFAITVVVLILQGLASYRMKIRNNNSRAKAHTYFAIQLLLSFIWPIILIRFQSLLLALIFCTLMLMFVILTLKHFQKTDKMSGKLFIPTVVWTLYWLLLIFMMFRGV